MSHATDNNVIANLDRSISTYTDGTSEHTVASDDRTTNDPNTSARSTFILLPVLPMGMAFAGVGQPNVLWMKVLGLLPFSAPTVLPVRMIMGEVGWWEFPLSIALLVGSVWLFRRAAAKVFRVSMLLYGKEPSWGEVIRWAREPV